jgi:hypothetical protein
LNRFIGFVSFLWIIARGWRLLKPVHAISDFYVKCCGNESHFNPCEESIVNFFEMYYTARIVAAVTWSRERRAKG